ncbi:hypothetical protein Cgig2_004773 [Carnegiea gigantea]|uniref:Heat shock protein 70 n=1 Tax=Carnegiea gigantea TaxID=171969 RepID=A0A9Q1QQU2_9CARY|nr:hypothetical protein Cgig2_004773 [Carnegiea gigantea]
MAGDRLGGGAFDNKLVTHFVDEFKREHRKDISGNPRALGRTVEKCLVEACMGTDEVDDVVFVGGSTRIPKVQAAILRGVLDKQQFLPVEVTPLSLGIEVLGGVFSVVIPRNTAIPTKMKQRYATVEDNQTVVTINVYKGEISIAEENNFLGKFKLSGITPAPKGVASIIVSFSINANGILIVTAEEESAGNKNQITITSIGEITRMVEEAKQYREDDMENMKVAKAKQNLENYANDMHELLRNCGRKMEAEDQKVIRDIVERTIQWLDRNLHLKDASKFERTLEKLQIVCQPLNAKLYCKGYW